MLTFKSEQRPSLDNANSTCMSLHQWSVLHRALPGLLLDSYYMKKEDTSSISLSISGMPRKAPRCWNVVDCPVNGYKAPWHECGAG